jgi:hypothetical protein
MPPRGLRRTRRDGLLNYLLDANHCSQLIQGHAGLIQKLADVGDVSVGACPIVQGEAVS